MPSYPNLNEPPEKHSKNLTKLNFQENVGRIPFKPSLFKATNDSQITSDLLKNLKINKNKKKK